MLNDPQIPAILVFTPHIESWKTHAQMGVADSQDQQICTSATCADLSLLHGKVARKHAQNGDPHDTSICGALERQLTK